jgi:hypothetical protein
MAIDWLRQQPCANPETRNGTAATAMPSASPQPRSDLPLRTAAGLGLLALAVGAAALLGNRLGWRITSAAFDRERLITGTKWRVLTDLSAN